MRWLEPWYNKYALIMLSAVSGLFGYEWICWSKLSASDWGTWAGAIGTVATLIGTIWLATESGRAKRNEERDRAFVAASGLMLLFTKVRAALENATEHFSDPYFEGRGFEYAVQARLIEEAGVWTEEQILPLIAIPNHVCAHLARARAEIFDIVKTLLEMQEIQGYSWVQESKKQRDDGFLYRIRDCGDTVSFCIRECRKFTAAVEATNRYVD